MAMSRVVISLLCVATLLGLAQSQDNCNRIVGSDLGTDSAFSTTGLISDNLRPGGDASATPPMVQLVEFNIVCEAQAQQENQYRYTSVVATFRCDSSDSRIPCLDSTAIQTQQFEFGCSSNAWVANIFGEASYMYDPNSSPTASLTTEKDSDCFLCINPTNSAVTTFGLTVTAETHCVQCMSLISCPNSGLERCYGTPASQTCCNYFHQSSCVESCPSPLTPTESFGCGCELLDDQEPNGEFIYTDVQNIGSMVTLNCDGNFNSSNPSFSATCTLSGWSEAVPTCEPVCGDIIDSCVTCQATGTDVTCSECDGDLMLINEVCTSGNNCDNVCIGAIIGAILGFLVIVALFTGLIILIYCCCRKEPRVNKTKPGVI